ncbi:MAG: hypothetical protein K6G63_07935 [Eubacterium sp.]|nr:hypothetical protein [Eubacterium sp.]
MKWDYAELSKAAKSAGGPEKLVDLLVESGRNAGRREMVPKVAGALAIGAIGYAGISKLVDYYRKKEQISSEAVENAKAELIQGITEYDLAHDNEIEEVPNKIGDEKDE